MTFSRLQLAAALLEYDNDLDDPTAPRKNAKESAIFAHLRRNPRPPRDEDEDDEDVPLRRVAVNQPQRRSASRGPESTEVRNSIVPELAGTEGAGRANEGAKVLSEWGLEAFAPTGVETDAERDQKAAKLKHILSIRERTHSEAALPNPHGPPSPVDDITNTSPVRRPQTKRPLSMGDIEDLVIGESPERIRAAPTVIDYRKSIHTNLDFSPHLVLPQEDSLESPEGDNFNSVAFPAKVTPIQTPIVEVENPFAVPLPSPDRMSRFDPKALNEERRRSIDSTSRLGGRRSSDAAQRRLSIGSMGSQMLMDAASHVPADPRSRTASMRTMGTKLMGPEALGPESIAPSHAYEKEDRRMSRIELMRPKLLVMPGPLQDRPGPAKGTRDGFFRSESGGFPLPPGSRTEARPGSSLRPMSTLTPSQSYNPRMSMSLSQLTFRQSLTVGGQRDPSYADLDQHLQRAEVDGEQAAKDWSDEEEEPEVEVEVEVDPRGLRQAGKLYGKSLIDNLEERKAIIKGQQRVFTGDQRSSMMSRPGISRNASSTLIDPSELRPSSSYLSPAQVQEDIRKKRASGIPVPLLNFEQDLAPNGPPPGPSRTNMPNSRSVFGVDKVWERELAKLNAAKEAEALEKAKLDALDARIADKKQAARASTLSPSASNPNILSNTGQQSSSYFGQPAMVSPLPVDEFGQNGNATSSTGRRRESAMTLGAQGWFTGPASDEEDESADHRRLSMASIAGGKPPYPRKVSAPSGLPQIASGNLDESDEDEDVPLAQQTRRSHMPAPRRPTADESDSEEDKPIAALKSQRTQPKNQPLGNFDLPVISFDNVFATSPPPTQKKLPNTAAGKGQSESSDEDDEVPLAVRHPTASCVSSMFSPSVSGGAPGRNGSDEDDKPLGVTHRASVAPSMNFQQQQLLQQQMLQQQIMMQTQAQMRASMLFGGTPMMSPAAFGMPFAPTMSMHSLHGPPMQAAQAQAAAQHSRVAQWRKDVQS